MVQAKDLDNNISANEVEVFLGAHAANDVENAGEDQRKSDHEDREVRDPLDELHGVLRLAEHSLEVVSVKIRN